MNSKTKKEIKNDYYWNWNNFKICWSVSGENNKKPIIFIHGFGASRMHWRKNIDYFAKKDFAAYSLDLLGFGDSYQPGIKEIGALNNAIWRNQIEDFIEQIINQKIPRK